MSARITAAEAAAILRDLARGREDGNGADVWPLYDRAEDAMAAVIGLAAESDAHRTRADAAEADRDALRAECERLRRERAAVDAIALEVTRESMAAGRRDADVIEDLTADRDAALAVIAGREVAPTDSELTAHAATGGGWLVSYGRRGIDTRNDPDFARITRDAACPPVRWWPLDRSGASLSGRAFLDGSMRHFIVEAGVEERRVLFGHGDLLRGLSAIAESARLLTTGESARAVARFATAHLATVEAMASQREVVIELPRGEVTILAVHAIEPP